MSYHIISYHTYHMRTRGQGPGTGDQGPSWPHFLFRLIFDAIKVNSSIDKKWPPNWSNMPRKLIKNEFREVRWAMRAGGQAPQTPQRQRVSPMRYIFEMIYENDQWSMVNGQWSLINDHWSMINDQWSMIIEAAPMSQCSRQWVVILHVLWTKLRNS